MMLDSPKILLIEDDLQTRRFLKKNLNVRDWEVIDTDSGTSGLALVKEAMPDLLILDYRLPNITGDIVAQSVDPNIPKLLITGDLEVIPKAHFLRIFRKPYNITELQDFIKTLQKVS
jgi:DNA-binding response OmpR family regulator